MSKVNFDFIRQCAGFMESKKINNYPWHDMSYEASWTGSQYLTVQINAAEMTQEMDSRLKRVFGGFEVTSKYYKHLGGEVILFEGKNDIGENIRHVLKIQIDGRYECSNFDAKNASEDDWDELKHKVKQGIITIENCQPIDLKSEEE
jgi:hypothetical protein